MEQTAGFEALINMPEDKKTAIFKEVSPSLMGLAYRILGTIAEAEDAVQDTYVKWLNSNLDTIENPHAWLTTVCSRRCIDILKSAHKTRMEYVGEWLPEPVLTAYGVPASNSAEEQVELASSLSTAFLLLLERLTPKERAAYLLYEIFGTDYAQIAQTLNMEESTCRKLVSRARRHIENENVRHSVPEDSQAKMLDAFQHAIMTGETGELEGLLAADVELRTDGGGKANAISKILNNKKHILKFIRTAIHPHKKTGVLKRLYINGQMGFVAKLDGEPDTAISFAFDNKGLIKGVFLVRNPDKLKHIKGDRVIELK